MKWFVFALMGLIALVSAASNVVTYCVVEDESVCFSTHVPDTSEQQAQNGSLYMQIRGPASMSYLSVGQSPDGTMAGANIFVVYAAQKATADGFNVTLSPRLGLSHHQPFSNNKTKASLLPGSGVFGDTMIANIKCDNCSTWANGGEMNLADTSSTWIYGFLPGVLRSNNVSAQIHSHSAYGVYKVNMQSATGGSGTTNSNPFDGMTLDSTTTSATRTVKYSNPSVAAMQTRVLIAHAVVMSLAFGLIFPAGAMVMRLQGKRSTWVAHAGMQTLALALSIAGMGLGIYLAVFFDTLDAPHVIIGLVVVSLACLMPVAGGMQHLRWVQRCCRTWWGRTHAYLGRCLILLAIINGGLGLQLADHGDTADAVGKGMIAYGVLVGIVGLVYLSAIAVTAVQRRRRTAAAVARDGPVSGAPVPVRLPSNGESSSSSDLEKLEVVDLSARPKP